MGPMITMSVGTVEKIHNIVIKILSPSQDNGNITYAHVVKNVTGNEQVSQSKVKDLNNLNGNEGNLVRSNGQSEIKRPSLVSLFMINPDYWLFNIANTSNILESCYWEI